MYIIHQGHFLRDMYVLTGLFERASLRALHKRKMPRQPRLATVNPCPVARRPRRARKCTRRRVLGAAGQNHRHERETVGTKRWQLHSADRNPWRRETKAYNDNDPEVV